MQSPAPRLAHDLPQRLPRRGAIDRLTHHAAIVKILTAQAATSDATKKAAVGRGPA
jgi:hypothetical protein